MQIASGNDKFVVEHAASSRKNFIDFISKVDVEVARESLEQRIEMESPTNQASLKRML